MSSAKLSGHRQLPDRGALLPFLAFSAITIGSFCAAFAFRQPAVFALPFVVLAAYIAIHDIRLLYLLLFAAIPVSVEFYFEGGTGTNLPDEPLMIALALVFLIYLVRYPYDISARFLLHPLIILLSLHLLWIAFTTFFSKDPVVSLKFLGAKLWYVLAFVCMTYLLVQHRKDFMPVMWCVFVPLLVLTVVTMVRHYTYDFRFDNVNDVVVPYFRNHVNYAAMLTAFLPFVWFARYWHRKKTLKYNLLRAGIPILLAGVVFAFTRGAWLALILAVISYYAIRWRVFMLLVTGGIVAVGFMLNTLMKDNRYLNFAPEFEKTIYHEDFGAHMAATFAGFQDVSSAERFYRWVAAKEMSEAGPWLGVGPGNFYPYYKHYTVSQFETYISENEERSTVHNYFLLMLVEQGLPGLGIFFGLTVLIFFYAQRIYHRTRKRGDKQLVMAITLSMVILMVQNMLSDLVETDKVGSLFFLNLALLVVMDLRARRETYSPAG